MSPKALPTWDPPIWADPEIGGSIRPVNIRVGHYFGALAAVSEPQSEKSMYIQAKNEHRAASGTQPGSPPRRAKLSPVTDVHAEV